MSGQCGEVSVFWPDDEACEAECELDAGHAGPHRDAVLGEWEPDA